MTNRKAKPMEHKRTSKSNDAAAAPAQAPTWDLEEEDNYAEDVNKHLGRASALLNLLAAGAAEGEYKPDQLQFALEAIEGLCDDAFAAFINLEELRGRSGPRKTERWGKRLAEAKRRAAGLDQPTPHGKAH